MKKKKISIVDAGLAGLASAIFLKILIPLCKHAGSSAYDEPTTLHILAYMHHT